MKVNKSDSEMYIVCVGASAGGLEAIETLFKHMPSDTGAAFVVVQHLSPDYKSMMAEILSKWTDMPVAQIRDGEKAERNQIYLIPPNKNIKIFNGNFILLDKDTHRAPNLPIDIFMTSLAEDRDSKVIGVVLSGTGSDGTNGLRLIKEHLGLTMAQDEYSAAFDGMPRSAALSGAVDMVLEPSQMPEKIIAYIQHPLAQTRTKTIKVEQSSLSKIFSLIREQHQIDFSMYKPTTVMRRIERRIQICQCPDIKRYGAYLQDHEAEVDNLFNVLLIGVTSFFRDPEVFDALMHKILPKYILSLPDDQSELRVWCSPCSSGEEAYTLAIVFLEALHACKRSMRLQVFATDLDGQSIIRASQGEFPEGISRDIDGELLAKYFHHTEKGYKVSTTLREPIVFAQHNLIKDPPFTKIDFVSCRNLLIYFLQSVQQKVIRNFNFSLVPGGMLLLGSSETTGDEIDLFDVVDRPLKIYRSRGIRRLSAPLISTTHKIAKSVPNGDGLYHHSLESRDYSYARMLEKYVDALADQFVECSILTNGSHEIIHATGKTSVYLSFPRGRISNDLTRIIHKDLSIAVVTAFNRLKKDGQGLIISDVKTALTGNDGGIRLSVMLVTSSPGLGELYFIWIEKLTVDQSVIKDVQVFEPEKAMVQRISDLEQSLILSQETIQATVEELETSNEELQAANEELLASNEELQSTNEELQSVNEELFTVNSEYQEKIQELTESNNDLDNFISSMEVAVIYLDDNLEIRRFTDDARHLFNMRNIDVGRPFKELANNLLNIDVMPLVETANNVHKTTKKVALDDKKGRYLLKCSPYNIAPGIYSGVVVSLMSADYLAKFGDFHEK